MNRRLIVAVALAAVLLPLAAGAQQNNAPAPYSCRLLYDEQRKCAFGSCDRRVIERLRKQCLIDGGRP